MRRRRRLSTTSSSSPELLNRATAVSAREEAGLGFYRRMGVTGGRFPSPGRQCRAGGVRNRGNRSPAALAHGGVSWRLSELARARGELGWCQGEAVSCKPGARERVLAEARRVAGTGGAGGVRRRRGQGAGRQGREMKAGAIS